MFEPAHSPARNPPAHPSLQVPKGFEFVGYARLSGHLSQMMINSPSQISWKAAGRIAPNLESGYRE